MSSETLTTWPNIEEALTSYSDDPATPIISPPPAQPKRPIPKHEFEGHERTVWSFVFLHDNVHIVSGSEDGTMRKWNCDTGLLIGKPWKGEGGWILSTAISPDGKTIACGMGNGSVQRWNTDGEMIEGVWTGHHGIVWSLSWSPSGKHIASGSEDGTILIRKVENGEIEVGPIEPKQDGVRALVYSPSGDRIASSGRNRTICIWDAKTGKLVVGPIRRLGNWVTSMVWSSDSTRLYSASDNFARVFDSDTGKELYRFKHDDYLFSVVLSPKHHHVLACVGIQGIAQLWDTESHQPLGQSFTQEDRKLIYHVSFSRNGRYLVHGGEDRKLTLWMVKEIAPELPSPTPSYLEVDATNPCAQSGSDDYYGNFFQSHHPSAPSGPSQSRRPHHSLTRRFWSFLIPSPASESIALQQRPKRGLSARHTAPQPVTVAAGRKKNRVYVALPPGKTNAQTGQSSSAAAHSAAQPSSTDQSPPQSQPQVQTATQQPAQQEDYGCWGNFCLALGCIPRPTRVVVSVGQSSSTAAQPATPPSSTPQSHPHPQPQVQTATQQLTQEENYGCWGSFCLALGCIPRRTRIVVSTAQPAASKS